MSIEQSKKVLIELSQFSLEIVKISKHFSLSDFLMQLPKLLEEGRVLIKDAESSLPELKNLSSDEIGELTKESYDMIKMIIAAISAK